MSQSSSRNNNKQSSSALSLSPQHDDDDDDDDAKDIENNNENDNDNVSIEDFQLINVMTNSSDTDNNKPSIKVKPKSPNQNQSQQQFEQQATCCLTQWQYDNLQEWIINAVEFERKSATSFCDNTRNNKKMRPSMVEKLLYYCRVDPYGSSSCTQQQQQHSNDNLTKQGRPLQDDEYFEAIREEQNKMNKQSKR